MKNVKKHSAKQNGLNVSDFERSGKRSWKRAPASGTIYVEEFK